MPALRQRSTPTAPPPARGVEALESQAVTTPEPSVAHALPTQLRRTTSTLPPLAVPMPALARAEFDKALSTVEVAASQIIQGCTHLYAAANQTPDKATADALRAKAEGALEFAKGLVTGFRQRTQD